MKDDSEISTIEKTNIFVIYIVFSCVFTSALNVIHGVFILDMELTANSFIMPTFAGTLFGYLLSRIKLLSKQLALIAYTDSLTRIYNRLHFGHFLSAEIDKVKRYGGTCSIIFFDIDYFKEINDKYGHLVGDEVLEKITDTVNSANRTTDVFARYGGEEFIILTASTNLEGATIHAEHLREEIARTTYISGEKITCSFGVAEFNKKSDDANSFIKRADVALYNAKGSGRNCVVQTEI